MFVEHVILAMSLAQEIVFQTAVELTDAQHVLLLLFVPNVTQALL